MSAPALIFTSTVVASAEPGRRPSNTQISIATCSSNRSIIFQIDARALVNSSGVGLERKYTAYRQRNWLSCNASDFGYAANTSDHNNIAPSATRLCRTLIIQLIAVAAEKAFRLPWFIPYFLYFYKTAVSKAEMPKSRYIRKNVPAYRRILRFRIGVLFPSSS